MSVDTITRINAHFKTSVEDVLGVFTIYKNVNEGLPEPSSGPFINLWIEPDEDDIYTDGGGYKETGQIIAHVRIEQGQSTLDLHSIIDSIKVAFRQLELPPTGTEEGQINIGAMSPSNGGTVPREQANKGRGSNLPWRRWDIIMNYTKRQC